MLSAAALPLFRLILVYISGILLAICYPRDLFVTLMLLLALSMLYLIVWIRSSTTAFAWFNLIGLLLIFLVGYSNLLLQATEQKNLSKWANQHVEGYTVCIQKVYHPLSCKALITHIKNDSGWHNHSAPIQLYFSKKSNYKPKQGDTLLIRGMPACIVPSENMQPTDPFIPLHHPSMHRHVLKQIDQDFIFLQPFHQKGKRAARITRWCSQTLQKQLQDEEARALVATLLWGAKDTLNRELQKAYAHTGTIHVLAISGLHVSMFYLLIKTVCRFVFRNIGFLILSDLFTLLWLWLYAWLCHFAPPILRATIMITMARLGFLMGRGSNPYNGLFASAFALLLWNPFLLLNCGFQLSYLATLGILYLQPFIHRLITLQNYWLQKIWTITTLSIAAQTSTLPLILYYFKQLPLYFIIANWWVVPATFAILMLSLALLVGSHLPIVGTLLGFILENLIVATNGLICWIAKWPMSTLSFCFVNGRSACLLYIVLLATILFLQHKHLIYPVIISVCTLLYAVDRIQLIVAKQKKCKMICYNNHQLSFTLKDGIEHLHCDDPPSNKIRHYAKGIIATWYKKVILTIDTIPSDWYGWRGAKLDADYLLIDEKLLPDIAIILKVCNLKTLVVYSKKAHPLGYNLNTKKPGIKLIWLKLGSKKILTWSKNL